MRSQRRLIHEGGWNILIILDACRPDYFEELYPRFFQGEYMVVKSGGCPTQYWIQSTFPDFYQDIWYISGNPYIVGNYRYRKAAKNIVGYYAGEHFFYVDDVWLWGWRNVDGIETVPPKYVSKALLRAIVETSHKMRIIAHYLQPHSPYIGRTKLDLASPCGARNQIIGAPTKFSPPMGRHDKLVEAYRDNLELVLKEVHSLLKTLEKYEYIQNRKIVITSDHSEYLGENGKYGHTDVNDPNLLKIPWLEVKKIL